MPTLGVDVDSTVWDTTARVREAVLEVTGEALNPADTYTWVQLLDVYGEGATTEIYERVLSPESISGRRPYPGAPEVLRKLQLQPGIKIHFITRNSDTRPIRSPLLAWLREHFGPETGLTVTTGDKLDILRDIGAFGLIDDRPETLTLTAEAGLWTAARIQPWNETLVARNPDVLGFSDWYEVPELLLA